MEVAYERNILDNVRCENVGCCAGEGDYLRVDDRRLCPRCAAEAIHYRIASLEAQLETASKDVRKAQDRANVLELKVAKRETECERRYTPEEVAAWLAEYHGRYREMTLTDWIARRREKIATFTGNT